MKINQIEQAVSDYFKIPVETIRSKSHERRISQCRQIVFYFAREKTKMSLTEIGNYYNKDHTTALWSINKVADLISVDKSFRKHIEKINNTLTFNYNKEQILSAKAISKYHVKILVLEERKGINRHLIKPYIEIAIKDQKRIIESCYKA